MEKADLTGMTSVELNGKTFFSKEALQECGRAGDRAHTFLEIGKVYAYRTVTMIYTGRLMAVSEQEFLVSEAAWIPETERWMEFADTGAHKEAEPYKRPIIINRGAMLDATEITSVVTRQK